MKTLITFCRVFTHLIGPPEVWLILYFLQNLVYKLLEHSANYLGDIRPRVPNKISSGSIVIVFFRPEIPSVLRNYLSLHLSLLLILLYPFVFINMIHELTYAPNRLPCQRLPQIVLNRR